MCDTSRVSTDQLSSNIGVPASIAGSAVRDAFQLRFLVLACMSLISTLLHNPVWHTHTHTRAQAQLRLKQSIIDLTSTLATITMLDKVCACV